MFIFLFQSTDDIKTYQYSKQYKNYVIAIVLFLNNNNYNSYEWIYKKYFI